MASLDSKTYVADGGYLQKGREKNIREADLRSEGVQDLLPGRWYRDEKIFQLERRAIFSRYWHVASFIAKFQKTGDYLTLEMFGWPFFLIKDKDGNIVHAPNAFHNVCRHRGHPVTTKDSGSTTVLACKFHGWTYLPTGALHTAREYMNLPNFVPSEHSLFRIHTHVTAQGFIFVNFDASPVVSIPFSSQFGDDFDSSPKSDTGKEIGNEYALFPAADKWVYDHTWLSETAGTKYNWKTFADGFQECYHCATGHPTTLPKDFCLNDYYLRQGHGSSRHFLPSATSEIKESYITWLYPIGAIIFSEDLLFIARFDATGALDTRYQSETYRRKSIAEKTDEHKHWMNEDIEYWRFVEREDVELAVNAQKGFNNGILAKGRLHPLQEHAVKWYQDKVRKSLIEHKTLEVEKGCALDYSVPDAEKEWEDSDLLCKLIGSELEW